MLQRLTRSIFTLVFILPVTSYASNFSFNGTFTNDDDQASFIFTLANPATVQLLTTSYANGGFAPILSLFGLLNQNDPALLGQSSAGVAGGAGNPGCGIRSVNVTTGLCLDALLEAGSSGPLAAGSYLLVLTEDPNVPLGPNLSNGFQYPPGSGNFTANGVKPGPFVDSAGNQMTGAYSVSINNVDSAVATPEPSTLTMLAAGITLLLVGLGVRRRHRHVLTRVNAVSLN